ncbi:hypothetical protein GAY33_05240 [Azospirillum brasilense]|uniref:hypothetical protein n=1 Tax=Azospirillum argentinense TaxID=2970906 RepID=UPI00190E5622|nr:hypothetical protein [Azospirillum argentinense]MBK3798641.1 hypothetical protein [Azospirillum argentinense]
MSDDVVQSAGAKLFIGTKAATPVYVEVGEIENFGEFGKTYQTVKFNPVGKKRTQKRKGSFDEGSLSLTLGRVPSDAGQAAMREALDDPDAYPFKITLDDAPDGVGATPTTFLFEALVMSYTTNIGGVDGVVKSTTNLEINSDIEEEAASA